MVATLEMLNSVWMSWPTRTQSKLQGCSWNHPMVLTYSLILTCQLFSCNRCFLLLQAYLEDAKLPISDYVNDTKTVIDQIPRLLAAMQYIAIQETTAAGSFELACQFSRVRQILETRIKIDEDPWNQLSGVSHKALRHMKKSAQSKKMAMPLLREVRAMHRDEAAKTLKEIVGKHGSMNVDRVLDAVYDLPLITVANMKLSQQVDKTTGTTTGTLSLEVLISHEDHDSHRGHKSEPLTVALLLGTPQRRTLLTYQSIGVGRSGAVKKPVSLTFDWNNANADGGESGGNVILRLLLEDVRGFDSEIVVPLR